MKVLNLSVSLLFLYCSACSLKGQQKGNSPGTLIENPTSNPGLSTPETSPPGTSTPIDGQEPIDQCLLKNDGLVQTNSQGVRFKSVFIEADLDTKNLTLKTEKLLIPVDNNGGILSDRLQSNATIQFSPSFLKISKNPLWTIRRETWNLTDEDDYGKWLKQNADVNFFEGSGVPVDCADTALALRWIFAREKGLPIGQTLAGSSKVFGSWESTEDWDKLASHSDWRKDERFKAALYYLLQNTYTHSIKEDLYPTEINSRFVGPGSIYLTLYSGSGHTRTITEIADTNSCQGSGCIRFIAGTLPASEWIYFDWLQPYYLDRLEGGFLRFRWPEKIGNTWSLRPANRMPGYSTEQFDWGEAKFFERLNERLQIWNDPNELLISVGNSLKDQILSRIGIVEKSYLLCNVIPCDRQSLIYEEFSTPQRDSRMKQLGQQFQNELNRRPASDPIRQYLRNQMAQEIIPFANLKLRDLALTSALTRVSGEPSLDIYSRWGVAPESGYKKLAMLALAFYNNWVWSEQSRLSPEMAPKVVQALGVERVRLRTQIQQMIPTEKASLKILLEPKMTVSKDCKKSCGQPCSAWDLLQ